MRHEDTYDHEPERRGDFIIGVLVGAAAGAAVALLFAPVRGPQARAMIRERVHDGLAAASATVDSGRELADKGRDLVTHSRELMRDATDTVAQAITDGRDAYRRVKART